MPRTPSRVYVSQLTLQDVAICSRCECELPITEFYQHGLLKCGEPSYNSWCKQCVKEYKESYKDKRIIINPKSGLEEILCGRCNTQKPVKEFYSQNYRYSKVCKVCFRSSRIAAE